MSAKVQLRALGVTLLVLSTFAGIVLFVARYEQELQHINWPLVTILSCFAFACFMIYRWQKNPGSYDFADNLKSPQTGKADPYRHFLWVFGVLGAWSVVQVVLAKEWNTLVPLLGMLLGYFVAKPAVDGIANAICNRGPQQPDADVGGPRP